MNFGERTSHLPRLLHDVIARLRLDAETNATISGDAGLDGHLRRQQGYRVEMLIEELRLLQVTIFSTLHKNMKNLEFSTLLPNVVRIADEVYAQLKQQMRASKLRMPRKRPRAPANTFLEDKATDSALGLCCGDVTQADMD